MPPVTDTIACPRRARHLPGLLFVMSLTGRCFRNLSPPRSRLWKHPEKQMLDIHHHSQKVSQQWMPWAPARPGREVLRARPRNPSCGVSSNHVLPLCWLHTKATPVAGPWFPVCGKKGLPSAGLFFSTSGSTFLPPTPPSPHLRHGGGGPGLSPVQESSLCFPRKNTSFLWFAMLLKE